MQYALVSAILKGNWYIEQNYLENVGVPLVANVLKGLTHVEKEKDLFAAYAVASSISTVRHSYYHGFDKAPQNSVAVVRLNGPLMKNDQSCGPMGMASIGRIIQEADSHHNISAMVLHIDSPGGTVDGTERLAEIVKATKKPIVAFVDGLMCSAALWIGTACDEVIADNQHNTIGSVGVISNFMDVQPYFEAMKVKFHSIKPDESKDKNKMGEDILNGNYDEYKKTVLSPLAQAFQSSVKENRAGVTDAHLTGKTYFAKDVVGVFVDEIGSYERAVTHAAELAEEQESESNNNSQNSASMKNLTALSGAMGIDALERESDGGISLTSDQAEAVNDALAASAQTAQENGEQLTAAQNDLATANNTIAEHEATIQARDERIAELEGASGAPSANVPVKNDPEASENESQENEFSEMAEAMASAQEIADLV